METEIQAQREPVEMHPEVPKPATQKVCIDVQKFSHFHSRNIIDMVVRPVKNTVYTQK